MSSAELREKTEHTSITGTEWLYLQLATSPYTVLKIALDTVKSWISALFDPGHPTTYYISADYVILDDDGYINILVDASSADVTVTLPTKADNLKRLIRILFAKDTAGTHKVIINPDAADSNSLGYYGYSVINLYSPGDCIEFVESQDTEKWEIIRWKAERVLHVREEQSSGTNGGTFTAGSYVARVLNTTKKNTITGASLASNTITLPAGKYKIYATAPASTCTVHKAKIYNNTLSADIIIGKSTYAAASYAVMNNAEVIGEFELATSTDVKLMHRCATTKTTSGLGLASSFGDVEVYAEVFITQVN